MIRICLNVNPNGLKNRVLSQGTDDSKSFRFETRCIGNYEYVNISSFAVLGMELWLDEESDLNRTDPLYSFKFIQIHSVVCLKLIQNVVIF